LRAGVGEYALDEWILGRNVLAIVADTADYVALEPRVFGGDVGMTLQVIAEQELFVRKESIERHHVDVIARMLQVDALRCVHAALGKVEPFQGRPVRNERYLPIAERLEARRNGGAVFKALRGGKD